MPRQFLSDRHRGFLWERGTRPTTRAAGEDGRDRAWRQAPNRPAAIVLEDHTVDEGAPIRREGQGGAGEQPAVEPMFSITPVSCRSKIGRTTWTASDIDLTSTAKAQSNSSSVTSASGLLPWVQTALLTSASSRPPCVTAASTTRPIPARTATLPPICVAAGPISATRRPCSASRSRHAFRVPERDRPSGCANATAPHPCLVIVVRICEQSCSAAKPFSRPWPDFFMPPKGSSMPPPAPKALM